MSKKEISNIKMKLEDHNVFNDMAGLSLQNLFITQTGKFPSVIMFTQDGISADAHFDVNGLDAYLKENCTEEDGLEAVSFDTVNLDTHEEMFGNSYVLHKDNLYFRIEYNPSESYILYDSSHYEAMKNLRETIEKFYVVESENADGHVFTLASGQMGFFLEKSKITAAEDFDIEAQYNDDMIETDELVRDFIEEKDKSGIVILHGEKGAGKTTYIRHLISEYPEIRFVTIPPAMVSYLNDPAFTLFMHDKLKNTVIILEDCESALIDRKIANTSNSVSVLLNIGDGLMSDDLGIKFICTFNAELGTIDEALLRKGRLAVKYEFKLLNVEKTKKLIPVVIKDKIEMYEEEIQALEDDAEFDSVKKADKIKRLNKKIERLKSIPEYTSSKGLSLADIYNIDEISFSNEKKQIGF